MNHKDFIAKLAENLAADNAKTARMVDAIVESVAQHVCDGDTVRIPDMGKFEPYRQYERIIVNPETGVRKLLPPRVTVMFTPDFVVEETETGKGVAS